MPADKQSQVSVTGVSSVNLWLCSHRRMGTERTCLKWRKVRGYISHTHECRMDQVWSESRNEVPFVYNKAPQARIYSTHLTGVSNIPLPDTQDSMSNFKGFSSAQNSSHGSSLSNAGVLSKFSVVARWYTRQSVTVTSQDFLSSLRSISGLCLRLG